MSAPHSSRTPNVQWDPSLETIKHVVPLTTAVSLAIVAFVSFLVFFNRSKLPLANPPAWYQLVIFKRLEFLQRGTSVWNEVRKHYGKEPYRLITASREVIVLPHSYADMIRNESRLSFPVAISKEFVTHVSGLEPMGTLLHEKRLLQTVIKKQLTKYLNMVTEPLSKEATFAVDFIYGNDPEWKEVTIAESMMSLISRLSSKVFLGDELCRNEHWLQISKEYSTMAVGVGAFVSTFPSLLQPLVPLFSKQPKAAKDKLNEVRDFLNPILAERQRRKAEAKKNGEPAPKYEDALEWIQEESGEAPVDAALYQMSLTLAAIHTTSDLLNQTLTRVANDPDLANELRKEIVQVLSTDGLKKVALANLKLMDSTLKETQRIIPISTMAMRRVATDKVVLPTGLVIPKGQYTCVDGSNVYDADIYPDPYKFDPYRYYRMREDPKRAMKAHLVSTSPEHLSFGHGIHSCPGRFFAANEMKIALCHLLLKYDWQLAPGASLEPYNPFAESMTLDPSNKLRYRRRQEEIDLDSLHYD